MNRRRHANTLPMLALLTWIAIAAFICASGLGYVYCKNQLHTCGQEIKRLERELSEIEVACEVAKTKIASLGSRSELQRKLTSGFIKLVPISDEHLVHVSNLPPVIGAADTDLRAVANERFAP